MFIGIFKTGYGEKLKVFDHEGTKLKGKSAGKP